MSIFHTYSAHIKPQFWLGAICLTSALFSMQAAQATPIGANLAISGSVGFDTGYAGSQLSGFGTQSGTLSTIQGGATTSSTFSGAAVVGANPLNGTLTDLGDGFGIKGTASAPSSPGSFGIGVDIGLNLANTSATDTYKITLNIAYDNKVDSSGADAFAHSNFAVFDRGTSQSIFFSDLFTDTVNGNQVGGVANGVFGGAMADNGSFNFAITLLAGSSVFFDPAFHDLAWTANGGSFAAGAQSSAALDMLLTVASVENITRPTHPTPEPATFALFALGLIGLGAAKRRRTNI